MVFSETRGQSSIIHLIDLRLVTQIKFVFCITSGEISCIIFIGNCCLTYTFSGFGFENQYDAVIVKGSKLTTCVERSIIFILMLDHDLTHGIVVLHV